MGLQWETESSLDGGLSDVIKFILIDSLWISLNCLKYNKNVKVWNVDCN